MKVGMRLDVSFVHDDNNKRCSLPLCSGKLLAHALPAASLIFRFVCAFKHGFPSSGKRGTVLEKERDREKPVKRGEKEEEKASRVVGQNLVETSETQSEFRDYKRALLANLASLRLAFVVFISLTIITSCSTVCLVSSLPLSPTFISLRDLFFFFSFRASELCHSLLSHCTPTTRGSPRISTFSRITPRD